MKKIGTAILSLGCLLGLNAQNNFPNSGDAKIQDANLTIETSQWRPSLLTLRDTHYNPDQVYHFQLESDGLKIKQDGEVNYQFKSGGNFIVRNGNTMLGIGNPLYKLHIKNPLGGAAIGLERGGKLWRFDLQTNSDRLFIGHSDNSSMVTFHKDGKVGIGTTNPDGPLEIEQKEDPNSDRALVISEPNNSQKIYLHLAKGINEYGYLSLGGSTAVRGNGQPSFFEGKVGIGTTSPDAKLTVKGDIHAQEVKVDLNGAVAPDYVFKEDYDLRSLQEVQDHIKEHGHLPNIPSAKELEANGIDLGQMNLKLLEKIEELVLYTLEQQAQIKELNQKVIEYDQLTTRLERNEEQLTKIQEFIKTKNQ